MAFIQTLKNELKAILLLTLYFSIWIGFLVLLKKLMLEQYQIAYTGLSMALVGALILAKVVIIMENVSLGSWVQRQPVIVDVALRTLLYTLGVAVVLILEKSFELRHTHGGLIKAVSAMFRDTAIQHVLANTICVAGALFVYNVIDAVREHLGPGGLRGIFLSPREN